MSSVFKIGIIKKVFAQRDQWIAGALDDGTKFSGVHGIVSDKTIQGTKVELHGYWQTSRYGMQVAIEKMVPVVDEPMTYFLGTMVSGIGPKKAERMVVEHGVKTIRKWLDESPRKLLQIHGIGEKILSRIVRSWKKQKHLESISNILLPLGFTQNQVIKTYEHFILKSEDDELAVEQLANRLKENIYLLTEVRGFGFSMVDSVAIKNKILKPDSAFRIQAACLYLLDQAGKYEGHSAMEIPHLHEKLDELLQDEKHRDFDYEGALEALAKNKKIHLGDGWVSHAKLYRAETYLKSRFRFLAQTRNDPILSDDDMEKYLSDIQEKAGIKYHENQLEAIRQANKNKINIIVGYAGTGKTTVTFGILSLYEKKFGRDAIFVTALSGVAADRVKKASGYAGGTIQSLLLGCKEDKLPYKVIVLDEASMVNSSLFASLVSRISDDARLVIVGDGGQLPPIGPGDVFMDSVTYRLAPVGRLTKIFRQSEDSYISAFASDVRQGRVPDLGVKAKDFFFLSRNIKNLKELKETASPKELTEVRQKNNEIIAGDIMKMLKRQKNTLDHYRRSGNLDGFLYSSQIITPMKNGAVGVDCLNKMAQETLNPDGAEITYTQMGETRRFRENDKVIHLVNANMECLSPNEFTLDPYRFIEAKHKKRIFNGYIGQIVKIDASEAMIWVRYLSENVVVRYSMDEAKAMLGLGYAMSIHKSQGSGFDNVIIPVSMSHYRMLNTRLFYTAITRAKKKCVVIGEYQAFRRACTNLDDSSRNTVIKKLEAA